MDPIPDPQSTQQAQSPNAEPASERKPSERGSEPGTGSEHPSGTGANSEAAEEVAADWPIRFTCLRLSTYHQYRRSYLDRWHRWLLFVVVISGTAAFSGEPELAAIAVVAGLADLVFALSDRARDHEFLYRRVVRLLGQVTADPDPSHSPEWQKELHSIYADAPPNHFRALDAWCHNLVVKQIGGNEFLRIRWHQRLLKNLLTFTGAKFPATDKE